MFHPLVINVGRARPSVSPRRDPNGCSTFDNIDERSYKYVNTGKYGHLTASGARKIHFPSVVRGGPSAGRGVISDKPN